MRRIRTPIVLAVSAVSLLALAAGAAYGQAEELWTARHNGSANAHDSAKAVVTDADGNVFVTGFERALGTGDDAVTRKYDPDGNLIWEHARAAVLNQIGWDIAVDSNGDVYVADSQFTVLKYSGASGELLWERVHGGNVLEGNVLELDSAGNVVVVGQRGGASTATSSSRASRRATVSCAGRLPTTASTTTTCRPALRSALTTASTSAEAPLIPDRASSESTS